MSPVHDQSYRRYQGARRPLGRAWVIILRAGVRQLMARRVGLWLLIAAWIPFLVRSVQIYAVATYPQAAQVLPVDMKMFQNFIEFQSLFAFFVTVYAGAGLIAADRRANALQVYLSKPIWRMEYIGGKFGVLAVFLAMVLVVPSLLLIAMQVALSGSLTFLRAHLEVVPAVFVASSLRVIVYALTMLALSSLSTSTRYVAVMYTGVVFFTEAVYDVLAFVTGSTAVAWISPSRNFDVVTDAIFRQNPRYDTPVVVSALVLLGLLAVSVSVLERRVRGVEIVA
jgi:ABC-type transport system involved in multi-copper enzyme maturation permease subunit